jgi:hypothetical protein
LFTLFDCFYVSCYIFFFLHASMALIPLLRALRQRRPRAQHRRLLMSLLPLLLQPLSHLTRSLMLLLSLVLPLLLLLLLR